MGRVWYNTECAQVAHDSGDPHVTEQQFQESDSFDHKKVQNDKIPGKRGAIHN